MEVIDIKLNTILVTGSSGFIGMHLCLDLLKDGHSVIGLDNMNNYYDSSLKEARLQKLVKFSNFKFVEVDISNYSVLDSIFSSYKPNRVVNLAAQAGVRYSLENPQAYIQTNIVGFMNVLECCRYHNVQGLIYASSSSIYGCNKKIPFSVSDRVDSPISIYAASKKSNELMAHSYSYLYNINTTGLRFFTVYGPWGRPDMAMYIFADKIIKGEKIPVFNNGDMYRDFTYIDDIVAGIKSSIDKNYKYEIFNLGNSKSESLQKVIRLIEKSLGKKAEINYLGMQPGDVKKTFADINHTMKKIDYYPKTAIKNGIPKFINWFKKYHQELFHPGY